MKCKLSDICGFRKGKVSVSTLTLQTYVSTENMLPNKGGIIVANSLPTVEFTQEYKKGDILVSNIRPYFKKIWQARWDGGCSNDVLVFQGNSNINRDFLYYILANDDFFAYSMATSKGTKMPRGDKTSIMKYEVPAFDIDTQIRIASVIRCLDEKIELNAAINKNLEQQARALMIDYCDKVYEGAPLGTIMSFINGFAFKSSTYLSNGEYRIITIKNVQDGQVDAKVASFINTVPFQMKPECNLQIGDVLISLTGNIGRVGIVCEDNLLLNQRVAKFQPFDRRNLPFLYFYYRLPETKTRLETIAKGTAQANLSTEEILKLEFPFNQSLMSELSDLLSGMFSIIENNQIQNLALAEMRDTLLPRLMSGELDVSNIDL